MSRLRPSPSRCANRKRSRWSRSSSPKGPGSAACAITVLRAEMSGEIVALEAERGTASAKVPSSPVSMMRERAAARGPGGGRAGARRRRELEQGGKPCSIAEPALSIASSMPRTARAAADAALVSAPPRRASYRDSGPVSTGGLMISISRRCEFVSAGETVGRLIDLDPLRVEIQVPPAGAEAASIPACRPRYALSRVRHAQRRHPFRRLCCRSAHDGPLPAEIAGGAIPNSTNTGGGDQRTGGASPTGRATMANISSNATAPPSGGPDPPNGRLVVKTVGMMRMSSSLTRSHIVARAEKI